REEPWKGGRSAKRRAEARDSSLDSRVEDQTAENRETPIHVGLDFRVRAARPEWREASRSSRSFRIFCAASSGYWVSLPSFQLASPLLVPIQSVPSRAASN